MTEHFIRILTILAFSPLATAENIDDLGWLSGCWASIDGEPGSGEQWTTPAGGTMFGIGRTVSGDKTMNFEYLRIVTGDDGAISLIASPSGQETAQFELRHMTYGKAIFENPNHDFPQRIIYQLDDKDSLLGRIEGVVEGELVVANFPMTRISCDGSTIE